MEAPKGPSVTTSSRGVMRKLHALFVRHWTGDFCFQPDTRENLACLPVNMRHVFIHMLDRHFKTGPDPNSSSRHAEVGQIRGGKSRNKAISTSNLAPPAGLQRVPELLEASAERLKAII